VKVWAGVSLFFAVGVVFGLFVANQLLGQLSFTGGFVGAVGLGAIAGAWFVFAIASGVVRLLRGCAMQAEPVAARDRRGMSAYWSS
jgi:hypothetical protein